MGARRRTLVLVLLALPLVTAPLGLAVGQKQETLEGTLRAWHGDTFSTPVDVGAGVDTTVAGLVALEQPGQSVHALAGRKVRAHGEHRNGVFAATGGVQAAGDATAAAATGTKTVGVLLFNFSNNATSQPWTPAAVRGVVFDNANSVDEYLRDASYGQLAITGDVHGWYTIDATNAGCAYTTWASQARSKATAAGVNLSAYQYIVYAFPQASSCGWAGLAYLPGTSSWINGAMSLRVVSHEVSHNLGVHHASSLACSTGTFTGSCSSERVRRSLHGDGRRADAAPRELASRAAWLVHRRPDGHVERHVPRRAGRALRHAADGSRRAWRRHVPEPRVPAALGAIFDNFSAGDPVVNGVSVRIAPAVTSIVQSKLVDANPSTSTFTDAALGVGKTIVDPMTGVSITTVSVGPAGASVSIQMPGGGDTQAPTGPASLSATPASSTSVQLNWPAATDNVGVTGYRVYRGGTQVAQTTALSYLDTGLAPQTTYAYQVRAYDAAENLGQPAPASATTPAAGDTAAPSVPTGLTAMVKKGRRVALSWNASSDNVGVVGYDVYRNGTRIAQPTGTSYSDRPPRGTFTYAVRARDAAGNVSGPSAGVTVTT